MSELGVSNSVLDQQLANLTPMSGYRAAARTLYETTRRRHAVFTNWLSWLLRHHERLMQQRLNHGLTPTTSARNARIITTMIFDGHHGSTGPHRDHRPARSETMAETAQPSTRSVF
jgi:hypothetical protein